MDRAGATKFLRQGLPLTSGAQHIHDRGKDPARWHRLPPASRSALIFALGRALSNGDQGLNLRPKLVGNFPRFYLWHLGPVFCPKPSKSLIRIYGYSLTVNYKDADDKQQAAVFELGKHIVRVTLSSLEARTG